MLEIIRGSLESTIATSRYPEQHESAPDNFRGRPEVQLESCGGEGECIKACPTGAIQNNPWRVDLGKCIFCGLCAEACPSQAIKLTQDFELAVRKRQDLLVGTKGQPIRIDVRNSTETVDSTVISGEHASSSCVVNDRTYVVETAPTKKTTLPVLPMSLIGPNGDFETMAQQIKQRLGRFLKRSLHIRHLDSGSCNGCDWELTTLLNPVHDIQRFGLDFVASPRHADVLLTTGVMTRNLTVAAIRTYRAMPEPRLVIAVGACGCSGGVFSTTYASGGGTDTVLPVDVYIPGCPPRPQALIYGLLLAVGRLEQKLAHADSAR